MAPTPPMRPKQIWITTGCILFNLLAIYGLVAYFSPLDDSNPDNWGIVTGMWISCIVCYLLLFTKIGFQKSHPVVLCLISIAVYLVIVFLGCMITASYFSDLLVWSEAWWRDILGNIAMLLFYGAVGTYMLLWVAVVMGLANVLWLVLFRGAARR